MFRERWPAAKRLSVNARWTFWTKMALWMNEITLTSAKLARGHRLEQTGVPSGRHTRSFSFLSHFPRVSVTNSGTRSALDAPLAGPANIFGGQRVQ